jgi:hypothetical protein
MQFAEEEEVNFVSGNGEEREGKILACLPNNHYKVRYFIALGIYNEGTIDGKRLLPIKAPFIRINGEVLTDDPSHVDDVGRIVAIGKALNGKHFFKIKFKDDSVRWFSEDRVFIDATVLAKWNEEHNDGTQVDHPDDVEALRNANSLATWEKLGQ